jgi:hypothetical protein
VERGETGVKVERTVNERGEVTISVSMPIPASIDPKDYDTLVALCRQNFARDWLKLETKA